MDGDGERDEREAEVAWWAHAWKEVGWQSGREAVLCAIAMRLGGGGGMKAADILLG